MAAVDAGRCSPTPNSTGQRSHDERRAVRGRSTASPPTSDGDRNASSDRASYVVRCLGVDRARLGRAIGRVAAEADVDRAHHAELRAAAGHDAPAGSPPDRRAASPTARSLPCSSDAEALLAAVDVEQARDAHEAVVGVVGRRLDGEDADADVALHAVGPAMKSTPSPPRLPVKWRMPFSSRTSIAAGMRLSMRADELHVVAFVRDVEVDEHAADAAVDRSAGVAQPARRRCPASDARPRA